MKGRRKGRLTISVQVEKLLTSCPTRIVAVVHSGGPRVQEGRASLAGGSGDPLQAWTPAPHWQIHENRRGPRRN